jgi:hypothetical protein
MENDPIRHRSRLGLTVRFEIAAMLETLETVRSKLRSRSGTDPASEGRLAILLEFADDTEESIRDLQRVIDE